MQTTTLTRQIFSENFKKNIHKLGEGKRYL